MKSKVIFNADDFGYCRAVNYGIVDAHKLGVLTSTTVMANMPGFDHAYELSKENPTLGIGIHLTLTCGAPVLDTHKNIAQAGVFLNKEEYATGKTEIDLDELYTEWRAQIEKVLAKGFQPTHLDSHHHAHTFGDAAVVFFRLAHEYNLAVRCNSGNVPSSLKTTAFFESEFDTIVAFGEANGLVQKDIDDYLEQLIEKILEHDTTEVMTHPAYIEDEIMKSSFNLQRLREIPALITSEFAKKIKMNPNIELITFGDL